MSLSDVRTAAINEVRTHQPQLVLADTCHDGIVLGSAGGRKQGLSELMFVRPLAGLPFKLGKDGFVAAAAEGLLDTVFAINLGNDLYGSGPTPIMLTTDKHATKVAICRGTPKSSFESASHSTVGRILINRLEKCGKQERKESMSGMT